MNIYTQDKEKVNDEHINVYKISKPSEQKEMKQHLSAQNNQISQTYKPYQAKQVVRYDVQGNRKGPEGFRDVYGSNSVINKRVNSSFSVNRNTDRKFSGSTNQNIYRSQATSPHPYPAKSLNRSNNIDNNTIKKLLEIQNLVKENPNIIEQMQEAVQTTSHLDINGKSNANYIHQVNELERTVSELRIQTTKQEQIIKDLEYELENTNQQLTNERNRTDNLNAELENFSELRDKFDEYVFEIKRLEGERDYHHKNHVELRKDLYGKTTSEFQIGKYKRELHYKTEELQAAKERCQNLEEQINELFIFAEKPRNEKQNNAEAFYAQKIRELEKKVKTLEEQKFQLENFKDKSFGLKESVTNMGIQGKSRQDNSLPIATI